MADPTIQARLASLPSVDSKALPFPIYYINLPQSTDRRQFMQTQLGDNCQVVRVEAIDGTQRAPRPRDGLYQFGPVCLYTSYKHTTSKLACTLSHLKALEQIQEAGHEWAIVCEDDAVFQLSSHWPPNLLHNLVVQGRQKDAGIIQLYWAPRTDDPGTNYKEADYTLYHVKQNPCWGTVGYLVSQRGVRDILGYTGPIQTSSRRHPVFVADPSDCEVRRVAYAHLTRQELNGVADSFLYGLTPTYVCGTPLLVFDNNSKPSLINPHASISAGERALQSRILGLYAC